MIAWARRPMQFGFIHAGLTGVPISCYRSRAKPNARGDDWYSTALAVPVSTCPSFLRKVPSLPLDRELTAVNLVDAGGNVDPHRAGCTPALAVFTPKGQIASLVPRSGKDTTFVSQG